MGLDDGVDAQPIDHCVKLVQKMAFTRTMCQVEIGDARCADHKSPVKPLNIMGVLSSFLMPLAGRRAKSSFCLWRLYYEARDYAGSGS